MAMEHSAKAMEDAMIERPSGATLSERVGECLRSRVIGTRAAGEVMQEVRAIDPALAAKFWHAMGRPTRNDDAAIVEIVNAVKAIEPKPAPPSVAGAPPA